MRARCFAATLVALTAFDVSDVLAHPFDLQRVDPIDLDAVVVVGDETFNLDLFVPLGSAFDHAPVTEAERFQRERAIKRVTDFVQNSFTIKFKLADSVQGQLETLGWADQTVSLAQVPNDQQDAGATIPVWVARLEGAIPQGARDLYIGLIPEANRVLGRIVFVARYRGGAIERVITKEAAETEVVIPARVSGLEVMARYLMLGFVHIIPRGLDHILFVLGLFLLSTDLRSLLWQISAFTLAHSVTLGLSIAGIWQIPGSIVEPIIAASVVYVAVENIFTTKLNPWRPALVFVFGLLHGMGFAGVLGEIGMPSNAFLTALLAFNVGVELGQLAVIAIAFALLFSVRSHTAYRRWVVIPASVGIAVVGVYWTIERVFF
ncbi:MAG: HupE/UreJ family protein [Myxococcota bacterium]